MNADVLVYGAYGHTGRFVVDELLRRGLTPVLSGRNKEALDKLGGAHPGVEVCPASLEELDDVVRGVGAVINCAGPFLDTAVPVATAAVAAGAHYLDLTAEQGAVQELYRTSDEQGWTDVGVIPAMAFYGGLADLVATAAVGDDGPVDEITVAFGLDRWWPTEGTRKTGQRNTLARLVVEGGRLTPVPELAPTATWDFGEPLGTHEVIGIPFSEIVIMARHLDATRIGTFLSQGALDDIRDATTPPPEAVDESGSSAQQFVVEVRVRRGDEERRLAASGRDIYAITAPLVVEATHRLLDGRATVRGAAAAGEAFDATDFLESLSEHLALRRS
jgi:NAD(P)-dependent dehydrogenase (short-subunit alcohol dehydrogenase family)